MKGDGMATSLDDLVNMTGVILAFEFTPDGTCTSYKNVTREMAAIFHPAHLPLTRAVRLAYRINYTTTGADTKLAFHLQNLLK
jgi:roadblock/LC7 domain-containing protein